MSELEGNQHSLIFPSELRVSVTQKSDVLIMFAAGLALYERITCEISTQNSRVTLKPKLKCLACEISFRSAVVGSAQTQCEDGT